MVQKELKLTFTNSEDNKHYEIPIKEGAVNATVFSQILSGPNKEGLKVFDPGYQNTAVVRSKICFIDGDRGILEYRGYPIEELAEKSTFTEVAYLLIYGELPTSEQLHEWNYKVMHHTFIHSKLTDLMRCFNYDAHPMGMFIR